MARYLIVNADDFGLSESVSRGIIKAHREGILTSTTFMVNFPWAHEMSPLLQMAPDLGVGIHLNLTTGHPLLPPEQVPSLVTAQGQFSKGLLHLRLRVNPAEVRKEWSTQVERGIALLGRRPTHLDTHRYLQGFPVFAQVMVDVARTYKIPAVRCLYPDLFPPTAVRPWTRYLLNRYFRRSTTVLGQSGVQFPTSTIAGDFHLSDLLQDLERVDDGVTERVCHPGELDDRTRSLTSLLEQREVELAALTAPEVRRKVQDLGIKLVSFRHFGA